MKGKPNRVTQDLREMIRGALEAAGGRDYQLEQAATDPRAFLALVARLVPAAVKADVSVNQPITVRVVTGFDSGLHER